MGKIAPATVAVVALLAACGPMPQIEHLDMSEQNKAEIARSMNVQIFEGGTRAPEIEKFLASLDATSCKNLMWEPPATKGNALRQLRLKAYRIGADAVINVYFDTRGTDAWGTNCWESVTATGDAVTLKVQTRSEGGP